MISRSMLMWEEPVNKYLLELVRGGAAGGVHPIVFVNYFAAAGIILGPISSYLAGASCKLNPPSLSPFREWWYMAVKSWGKPPK